MSHPSSPGSSTVETTTPTTDGQRQGVGEREERRDDPGTSIVSGSDNSSSDDPESDDEHMVRRVAKLVPISQVVAERQQKRVQRLAPASKSLSVELSERPAAAAAVAVSSAMGVTSEIDEAPLQCVIEFTGVDRKRARQLLALYKTPQAAISSVFLEDSGAGAGDAGTSGASVIGTSPVSLGCTDLGWQEEQMCLENGYDIQTWRELVGGSEHAREILLAEYKLHAEDHRRKTRQGKAKKPRKATQPKSIKRKSCAAQCEGYGVEASEEAPAAKRSDTEQTLDASEPARPARPATKRTVDCEYAGREGLLDLRPVGLASGEQYYYRVKVLGWFQQVREWLVVNVAEDAKCGARSRVHTRPKDITWCGSVSKLPYTEHQKVMARWFDGFFYSAKVHRVHPSGCGGCEHITYDVWYDDDNSTRKGLTHDDIWEKHSSAMTYDLRLLPVAQRLGKMCTALATRYADLAWQGEGTPAYTCEMDEESLCTDAIGAVVERMHLLNSELPVSEQLPVNIFNEKAVQGTRQCMELIRSMACLCNRSVDNRLKFLDDNRDGTWLDWTQWCNMQERNLQAEIHESPTADFVKSCCTSPFITSVWNTDNFCSASCAVWL